LLVPLLVLMVYMGVHPRPFLQRSRVSVNEVRARVVGGETGGDFRAAEPGRVPEAERPKASN
jgi:hypothetical protein